MAINKKLIHFQTMANFNSQMSAGNILGTSIVFIKDAKKIWTHGEFYDCGETDLSEYITESELNSKSFATTIQLNDKVDKVSGKQLSTEDFTSALKTKLEGLSNYDDTELSEALSTLRGDFDKLVSGDTTTAIKTFNEVIAFLDGIQDTQDLAGIIASIEQQIAGKYTKPSGGIPASDLAPDVFLQGEKGEKGDTGPKGEDGVGITSVVQTTTSSVDGGSNVVTVTLSDGKTSTFTVKNGSKGSQGEKGDKGDTGAEGPQGVQGIQGPKGDTGADGAQGPKGDQGEQGPKGDKGDKGDTGAAGTNGTNGVSVSSVKQTTTSTADGGTNVVTVTLSNGTTSTFNVKNGSKGSNGTNGTNGKDGANGATFTPSVDSAGNLSWTNDSGLTNPPTVNIKGPKGDKGDAGSGGGGGSDSSVFITHFTVSEFVGGNIDPTDEQVEAIRDAARQNKIIGLLTEGDSGFLVSEYYYFETEDHWFFSLTIINNGASYNNSMNKFDPYFRFARLQIQPFKPLVESILVDEDGRAIADSYNKDNLTVMVDGECRYLMIGEVGFEFGMTVRFFTGEDCTIEYWGNWANGVIPTIEPYTAYEMSIVWGVDYNLCAVLTPFKYAE